MLSSTLRSLRSDADTDIDTDIDAADWTRVGSTNRLSPLFWISGEQAIAGSGGARGLPWLNWWTCLVEIMQMN